MSVKFTPRLYRINKSTASVTKMATATKKDRAVIRHLYDKMPKGASYKGSPSTANMKINKPSANPKSDVPNNIKFNRPQKDYLGETVSAPEGFSVDTDKKFNLVKSQQSGLYLKDGGIQSSGVTTKSEYGYTRKHASYEGDIQAPELEPELIDVATEKAKDFASHFVHKLPEDKRTDVMAKAMPYRFNGWVAGSLVTGSAALAAKDTAIDVYSYNHARKIGPMSYGQMANQVGVTPSQHSAKFVKNIPTDVYTSTPQRLLEPAGMYQRGMLSYDDGSAGGDLVFAMHNLR